MWFTLHGGSLLKPPCQIHGAGVVEANRNGGLDYSKPPYQLCWFAWEIVCLPAVFFFSPLGRQMFEYEKSHSTKNRIRRISSGIFTGAVI